MADVAVSCNMNFHSYPMDTHDCDVLFTSANYLTDQLVYVNSTVRFLEGSRLKNFD